MQSEIAKKWAEKIIHEGKRVKWQSAYRAFTGGGPIADADIVSLVQSAIDEATIELKQALSGRTVSCSNCNNMAEQLSSLREKVRAYRSAMHEAYCEGYVRYENGEPAEDFEPPCKVCANTKRILRGAIKEAE